MWAADAWGRMGQDSTYSPPCWGVERVAQKRGSTYSPPQKQPAARYFREALTGAHCSTNWYEGNFGDLGQADRIPKFTSGRAPALLGFDESIDEHCTAALGVKGLGHADACVRANLNILSLCTPPPPLGQGAYGRAPN